MDLASLRIGYVPNSPLLSAPGDRRRFVHYASERSITFEIANPTKRYDVVIISERADLSVWSNYQDGLLVYDLIDSYLAIPRTNIKGCLRGLAKFITRQSQYPQLDHWKAIEIMCKRADAVICTTLEQKLDISQYCNNIHIILDSHSGVARTIKRNYSSNKPFRLVWEGLPNTISSLEIIRPALERLCRRYSIELWVVTDLEYYRYLGRFLRSKTQESTRSNLYKVRLMEWKEETAADIICSCDLAVIPIDLSDPFAFGKPENKLLLFWRMGMPVLTSSTPAYVRAMDVAGLDMSCANSVEWEIKIEEYLLNNLARKNAAFLGNNCVKENYCEEENLKKWDAMFETLFSS